MVKDDQRQVAEKMPAIVVQQFRKLECNKPDAAVDERNKNCSFLFEKEK